MIKSIVVGVIIFLWLLGVTGYAQTVPPCTTWNLVGMLPGPQELLGWKYDTDPVLVEFPLIEGEADFYATRDSDKLYLVFWVGVCTTVEAARQEKYDLLGSSSPTLEDMSYHDFKIGEKVRVDKGRGSIHIQDGRVGIVIRLMCQTRVVKTASGEKIAIHDEPTPEDVLFALDLSQKVLDRLTVMGVTHRPKESAPQWAKDELPSRLALAARKKAEWEAKERRKKADWEAREKKKETP